MHLHSPIQNHIHVMVSDAQSMFSNHLMKTRTSHSFHNVPGLMDRHHDRYTGKTYYWIPWLPDRQCTCNG